MLEAGTKENLFNYVYNLTSYIQTASVNVIGVIFTIYIYVLSMYRNFQQDSNLHSMFFL